MRFQCLFVLLISLLSIRAQAQQVELPDPETLEQQCAPEIEANRRATLTHAGIAGLWFHLDVARCMAERLRLLPMYARHVRLLEEREALSDERDALRAREVDLASREAQTAREALEAALRRVREAEEALGAWYRHPALWVTVGAVLVIAIEVVSVYALGALSP